FGAHSENLAAFSDAFPVVGSGIVANGVVRMDERADVLLMLLQLTHRQRWIRSDKIPFGLLQRLAEASEKFFIPAIMECHRAAAFKHPLEVFMYACKHGYDDTRDAAAPGTLDLPFESTLRILRRYPSICTSWVCENTHFFEIMYDFIYPRFRFAIDMWRHLCNSTVMTQILNIASSVSTGKPSGADPFCR
ncbi:uncharacterized protein C8R40DRAFT_1038348, partial [Lentinula edodes]|uniref:uncharacterized protein n=1 Tax=Lentinula edodes TaxID=5353 RepID=UPI001E8EE107